MNAQVAGNPNWVFSPDPAVETLVGNIRSRHPPFFPDGTERIKKLLQNLGDPHRNLPPVFHVAGTNGKGSTLAFLQAVLESSGLTVHKFISPHLVRFEERIIVGGREIDGGMLCKMIAECEAACTEPVSFFEFFTALAFLAFSRVRADAVLLETGLGGLNDATNVFAGCVPEEHLVSILTRISFDHMPTLGATLAEIARHKAGIMVGNCPAIMAPQPDESVRRVFADRAQECQSPLYADWKTEQDESGFTFKGANVSFRLPLPRLQGCHQVINAGTALAALEKSPFAHLLKQDVLEKAMRSVKWQGRLQRLTSGPLVDLLPAGAELWLDGAHNDSGAETLVDQAKVWGKDKPLHVITAYKRKKDTVGFYEKLRPCVSRIVAVEPAFDAPMLSADELCDYLRHLGFDNAATAENLESAVKDLAFSSSAPPRILVTGSLYLVGHVLRSHS